MLERQLSAETLRKLLAVYFEQELSVISTHGFLTHITNITGNDLKIFAGRWIYGKGCPKFSFGFWFNRKKHQLEIGMQQRLSNAGRITGSLNIRVNELDGSYDHLMPFDDEYHAFEIAAHARIRKARKRKNEEDVPIEKQEIPILWLRFDPENEFLHEFIVKQPEYMWLNQLNQDLDVPAQIEAIRGVTRENPGPKALDSLNKVLSDPTFYFKGIYFVSQP